MKFSVTIGLSFVCFNLFVVAIDQKELCRTCVRMEECALYHQMNKREQEMWIERNSCENRSEGEDVGILFGFAPFAKGDYICCPEANVWGIEDSDTNSVRPDQREDSDDDDIYRDDVPEYTETNPVDYDQNKSRHNRRPGSHTKPGKRRNNHRKPFTHEPIIQNSNRNHNGYPNGNIPNLNQNSPYNVPNIGSQGSFPNARIPNPNYNNSPQGNGASYPSSQNSYSPPVSFYRPPINNQDFNNPQSSQNSPTNRPTNTYPNPAIPSYNVPQVSAPNNRVPNSNYPQINSPNFADQNRNNQGRSMNNGNVNNNQGQFQNPYGGGVASGEQCSALTSYPPDPITGCCGKDWLSERNNGPQNNFLNRRPAGGNQNWPPMSYPYPRRNRETRPGNETVDVSVDNRITGGKETELHQFPWTVLLKTTFDYGSKTSAFNCGGSIISPRYLLTAAHCVQEDNARVTDVEVYLAEYDKRSFPNDCVRVLGGEGRKCIENIVTHAEYVIPHPQYDDQKLQNDIALIRLGGNAPFTEFIRPICLPPIDIDNPAYSNLRVAIAGWGRNGQHTSQVKQSAIVHLVPQRECSASYPQLTRRHLCAAGHSGEDTCKGDSGGPLMMLYEGRYYVSGVVSGKRADAPCGTSVPSLYTNVYHYLDWIRSNIRN